MASARIAPAKIPVEAIIDPAARETVSTKSPAIGAELKVHGTCLTVGVPIAHVVRRNAQSWNFSTPTRARA
jgi:hypothetical protein